MTGAEEVQGGAIPNMWIQLGERKQRVFYEFPGGEPIAEAQVDDPATPGVTSPLPP